METRETTQITQGDDRDYGLECWSPDGMRLAVTANVDAHPDLRPSAEAIFLYPAAGLHEGAEPVRLNAPLGPKSSVAWSPDGAYLAYLGHDQADEVWGVTNAHPWIVPTDGAPARDLTPGWDVHCGNTAIGDVVGGGENGPFWAADSQSVLVGISESGSVNMYRVPLSEGESPEKRTDGQHVVAGFTACKQAENVALLLATSTDGGDLYTLNLTGGTSEPHRLTELNAEVFSGPQPSHADCF